jgi:hypothetical protein
MAELRRILQRRDTAEQWESINPALRQGEIGLDLTNKRMKVGDGFNNWNDLDYMDQAGLDSLRAEYGNEVTFGLNYDLHRNSN